MSQPIIPPPAAVVAAEELLDDEQVAPVRRDVEDKTPVGEADREADVRRSGGDPDEE